MLTVFFFAPLEVVLLNRSDFYIPFSGIWLLQLGIAAAVTAVVSDSLKPVKSVM